MIVRTLSFILAILSSVLCFFIPLHSAGAKKGFYGLLAGALICFLFWGWANYGGNTQIIGIILVHFFWGALGGLIICLIVQFFIATRRSSRPKYSKLVQREKNERPIPMDSGPASGI